MIYDTGFLTDGYDLVSVDTKVGVFSVATEIQKIDTSSFDFLVASITRESVITAGMVNIRLESGEVIAVLPFIPVIVPLDRVNEVGIVTTLADFWASLHLNFYTKKKGVTFKTL